MDRREFVLLFMTFDENKSWYYEENRARIERKNRRTVMDPNFHESLKFDGTKVFLFVLEYFNLINTDLFYFIIFDFAYQPSMELSTA